MLEAVVSTRRQSPAAGHVRVPISPPTASAEKATPPVYVAFGCSGPANPVPGRARPPKRTDKSAPKTMFLRTEPPSHAVDKLDRWLTRSKCGAAEDISRLF